MLHQKTEQPFYRRKRSLRLNGRLLSLDKPIVMGILNATPDSFFDGSRYQDEKMALERVGEILGQGALIVDIGAVSTRPGAAEVSEESETGRLIPLLRSIRRHFPEAWLSVDTYRSGVVKRIAGEIGGIIVNDVSGGTLDKGMFETVANLGLPYVLTHMQGTPRDMQDHPVYGDVVSEVMLSLSEKVNELKLLGVCDIIVDPGFGFGKSQEHNYRLLNHLDSFGLFELPLLVGLSRKTMIWKFLGITPGESLNGTTVLNTMALLGGADILRVHDVREAMEAIRLVEELKR